MGARLQPVKLLLPFAACLLASTSHAALILAIGSDGALKKTMPWSGPESVGFFEGRVVYFNDQRIARSFIRNEGPPLTMMPLERSAIAGCVKAATADIEGLGFRDKLREIYRRSMASADFDFRVSECGLTRGARLVVVDRVVYDIEDFGNFMWGMAMRRLKIPVSLVKLGSEYNAVMFAYEQNSMSSMGGKSPFFGLDLRGDSREDQNAIIRGYISLPTTIVDPPLQELLFP